MNMIFDNHSFIFANVYGILTSCCLVFLVLAVIRRQWNRVALLVIALPFLIIGFLDNFYSCLQPEIFNQLIFT